MRKEADSPLHNPLMRVDDESRRPLRRHPHDRQRRRGHGGGGPSSICRRHRRSLPTAVTPVVRVDSKLRAAGHSAMAGSPPTKSRQLVRRETHSEFRWNTQGTPCQGTTASTRRARQALPSETPRMATNRTPARGCLPARRDGALFVSPDGRATRSAPRSECVCSTVRRVDSSRRHP